MRYTHVQFAQELEFLKSAAYSEDPALAGLAAARAGVLLGAVGVVGSIVASRRSELESAMSAANATVVASMAPAPPVADPVEPLDAAADESQPVAGPLVEPSSAEPPKDGQ